MLLFPSQAGDLSTGRPSENTENKPDLSLDRVRRPCRVEVLQITGGRQVLRTLASLSIRPGDILQVRRAAPFAGPILIESAGTKVAVGRGMAQKILVRMLP